MMKSSPQPLRYARRANTKHSLFVLAIFMLFGCDNQEVVLLVPAQKVAKKEQIISKFYALKDEKMTLFFTDTSTKKYNLEIELLSEDEVLFYDYNKENSLENSLKNTLTNIYISKKNDTNVQRNYLYYYLKDKIEIRRKIEGKEQIYIEIIEDKAQKAVQQTYFDENNPTEKIIENLFIYKDNNSNLLKEKRQLLYENNAIKTRISTFFEYNSDGNITKKIKFNAQDTTNMSQKRFIYEKLDTLHTQQKSYIYNEKKQLYKLQTSKIMPQNANINDFVILEKIFEYDTQGRCTQVRTFSIEVPKFAYSPDTTMKNITIYEYK